MSLIKCPECNKEISEKAKCCPNCGYELPIKQPIFQGIYCPKCLDSGFRTQEQQKCWLCKIEMINSIEGTIEETHSYTDNHPELKNSPEFDEQAYQRRINWVPVEYGSHKSNVVKCPYCSSSNITKISTVNRVVSTGLFGLGSKKIGKQWHCNQCKSDF